MKMKRLYTHGIFSQDQDAKDSEPRGNRKYFLKDLRI